MEPAPFAPLTDGNRARLRTISVSTLSTCLYRAGVRRVCPTGIAPVRRGLSNLVGEAYTLRFIPMREDIGGMSRYGGRDNAHQMAFEECPPGHVLVIDSRSELRACSCGNLLIGRLQARGCAGIVTDGGFRDTPEIEQLGFPAYQRQSVPAPSFGHLHAVEANVPIGCSDVAVLPGDIVVGDAEGVVVIPASLANRIAEEAWEQTRYEVFAAAEVARGRSIIGLYPATEASRAEFSTWAERTGLA